MKVWLSLQVFFLMAIWDSPWPGEFVKHQTRRNKVHFQEEEGLWKKNNQDSNSEKTGGNSLFLLMYILSS